MQYGEHEVWIVLESFDRLTNEFCRETRIDGSVGVQFLSQLVGAPSADDFMRGEWRVEGPAGQELERVAGVVMDDVAYEYFVGARQAR